jgi:hypothetical protein
MNPQVSSPSPSRQSPNLPNAPRSPQVTRHYFDLHWLMESETGERALCDLSLGAAYSGPFAGGG